MYAKKTLGQHFLKCSWVLSTLVKSSGLSKEDTVLEIGPGTGVLTRELSASAKKVVGIEKDEVLAENLRGELTKEGIENVEIIEGDILKWNIPFTEKYKVVANIPYYLTSRLIKNLLEVANPPESIVFTVQKEVAKRIIATPPHMNLLGLSVQIYGFPEFVKSVPAECFSPRPKIDSAIIKISNISKNFFSEHDIEPADLFSLLRQTFTLKRKTLLNALGKSIPRETRESALKSSGIDPKKRPQELNLEEWAKLAKELRKK